MKSVYTFQCDTVKGGPAGKEELAGSLGLEIPPVESRGKLP